MSLPTEEQTMQIIAAQRDLLLEAAKAVIRAHSGSPYTSGDRDNARKRLAEAVNTIEKSGA